MPTPDTEARRPLTLIVTVEAAQPLRVRVQHDRPEDEGRAYWIAAEAARLVAPLRDLMQKAA